MSNPSNSIEIGITPANGDFGKNAYPQDDRPASLRSRDRLVRLLAIRSESSEI
jgi:hypothetical protein